MTNEEAIEKLKANIEVDEYFMKLYGLNNCPDFKLDILACESAIKALEKQIPKKAHKRNRWWGEERICPNCWRTLLAKQGNFCTWCGQRLDRSNEQ